MDKIRLVCKRIVSNSIFEWSITVIIFINALLVGIETYSYDPTIELVQCIILGIFSVEIIIRFLACKTLKEFFFNGWNIFDLTLVLISYIPENIVADTTMMMSIRVVRIFRVLRLLRAAQELKLIVSVLLKSMVSMFYNIVLFIVFIYMFAIVGVSLFKLPNPDNLDTEEIVRYKEFMQIAPNSPNNSPDPFGTLHEAMFTLFRELTGEDWTDLRYNHITAYQYGLLKTTPSVITTYHVLWFVLSAFLLLNLVTGTIINNYQSVKDEQDKAKKTIGKY